jgi:hypothetical protein
VIQSSSSGLNTDISTELKVIDDTKFSSASEDNINDLEEDEEDRKTKGGSSTIDDNCEVFTYKDIIEPFFIKRKQMVVLRHERE